MKISPYDLPVLPRLNLSARRSSLSSMLHKVIMKPMQQLRNYFCPTRRPSILSRMPPEILRNIHSFCPSTPLEMVNRASRKILQRPITHVNFNQDSHYGRHGQYFSAPMGFRDFVLPIELNREKALEDIVNDHHNTLTHISLAGWVTDEQIITISKKCNNITHLNFSPLFGSRNVSEAVILLVKSSPKLTHLNLSHCRLSEK